jgi:hypothetical protein
VFPLRFSEFRQKPINFAVWFLSQLSGYFRYLYGAKRKLMYGVTFTLCVCLLEAEKKAGCNGMVLVRVASARQHSL